MKKEFEKPQLSIINFINDDIMTASGPIPDIIDSGNDDGDYSYPPQN